MRSYRARHGRATVALCLLASLGAIAPGCRHSGNAAETSPTRAPLDWRGGSGMAKPTTPSSESGEVAARPPGGGLTRASQPEPPLPEGEYVLPGPDEKTAVNDADTTVKR